MNLVSGIGEQVLPVNMLGGEAHGVLRRYTNFVTLVPLCAAIQVIHFTSLSCAVIPLGCQVARESLIISQGSLQTAPSTV